MEFSLTFALITAFLVGLLVSAFLTTAFMWRWITRRMDVAHEAGANKREPEIIQLRTERDAIQANLTRAENLYQALQQAYQEQQTRLLSVTHEHAMLVGQMQRLSQLEQDLERSHNELRQARETAERAENRAIALATKLEEQRLAMQEKLNLLEQAREQMSASFKSLATEILEDKSKRFTEQNSANLGQLLNPLKEQLKDFHKVVIDTYDKESRERGLLKHEIEALKNLNQQIGEDALNLTRALKGESRVQGAWGELILERLLEASGLQKGREYETQVALQDNDGGRPRPDVIIRLPEGRDLIIDAKVSLTAYERYCSASEDGEREQHLMQHLNSIRTHVKALSKRSYSHLPGINSLEFVFMFIPVEAAFIEAVRHDNDLCNFSTQQQIIIVTTSTLLATLRTVGSLWRFEERNRHAMEIADRAGKLYDKFVGFVEDMEKVNNELKGAQSVLDNAFGKLKGHGGLVSQVQKLKDLGAKASKSLSAKLLQEAEEEHALPAPIMISSQLNQEKLQ